MDGSIVEPDIKTEQTKLCQDGPEVVQAVGGLRILTWNINGIRSLADFPKVLQELPADVICLQETKVTRDMLTESVSLLPGFTSYFSFSRRRKIIQRTQLMAGAIGLRKRKTRTSGSVTYHIMSFCMLTVMK